MTDAVPLEDVGVDSGPWLVEPDHPSLATAVAARINDPGLPDRLAWNAFRTLAMWNTDVWVPSFLESALGRDNPLSGLEWADATVELWRSGLHLDEAADVVLEARDAVVLVEATFRPSLSLDHLVAGADHALDLAMRDGRQAGYVLVAPAVEAEAERVSDSLVADLLPDEAGGRHGLRPEALQHVVGWLTWADVGALVLDLAEEADALRVAMAHRVVTELQEQFPGVDL